MQDLQNWDEHRHDIYTDFEFYHHCYDATLALAYALNRTVQGIPHMYT